MPAHRKDGLRAQAEGDRGAGARGPEKLDSEPSGRLAQAQGPFLTQAGVHPSWPQHLSPPPRLVTEGSLVGSPEEW